MVSASFVLLGALVVLGSTAEGSKKFVSWIPNGANVEGYAAIGHPDGTGKDESTNDFGEAFEKAGKKWTVELCQADTDGDGQTNGQELGDPCCEWSTGPLLAGQLASHTRLSRTRRPTRRCGLTSTAPLPPPLLRLEQTAQWWSRRPPCSP